MTKSLSGWVVLLVAGVAIAACSRMGMGDGVQGSGVEKVEIRPVEAFEQVEISGAFDVEITFSETQTIHVTGDDNIVPLIKTKVKGATLHLESDRFASKSTPVVRVVMPKLTTLGISGAGNVTVRGASGDALSVNVSGAGRVMLAGSVRSFELDVSGAGKIDAVTLQADRAKVAVSGAATVELTALQSLQVKTSGASKVRYSGEPAELKKDVTGASSVEKR